jgi:hypothetical protein
MYKQNPCDYTQQDSLNLNFHKWLSFGWEDLSINSWILNKNKIICCLNTYYGEMLSFFSSRFGTLKNLKFSTLNNKIIVNVLKY